MSENTEFQRIWTEALAEYERNTGRDLKVDPNVQNLANIEDLLSEIQSSEQRFKDFRARRQKLWSTLRRCMSPVELAANLVKDALGNTPYAPINILFSAILYLVKAANGVMDSYNSIESLLLQLQDFMDRLQEYVKYKLDASLRRRLIAILTTLLEILARSEEMIKQGRFKKYMATTFTGADNKLAAAMSHLKDLSDSEQRQVTASTFSTTRRTLDVVEGTADAVERSEKTIGNLATSISDYQNTQRSEKDCQLIKDVLYSLALSRVQEIHGTLCHRRLPGSGAWLQDETLFQTWVKGDDAFLWILGNPGAGKSFLSSYIVSILDEYYPQDPIHPSRVSVAYWFIKEDDQDLSSLPIILKGLAYQIAESDPVYAKHAANVCGAPSKINGSLNLWKRLFLEFFESGRYNGHRGMIIIDGLDEAARECREGLLAILRQMEFDFKPQSSSSIRFAIVGRPEIRDDILSIWEKHTACIDVSPTKNTADIFRYIESEIRRIAILRSKHLSIKAKQDLRTEIVEKLVYGANGMFLWVNLMIDQICRKSRPSEIKAALNEAPRDLLQMIRHVFERLSRNPDVGEDDLNEILTWVTCVKRPLSLAELDIILRLRSAEHEPVPDLEERLRGLFASFFTLIRSDGKATEDLVREMANEDSLNVATLSDAPSDNAIAPCDLESDEFSARGFDSEFRSTTIRFSHASIKDYLLQEGAPATRRYSEDLVVGIDLAKSEGHILKTCLTVLADKDHEEKFGLPNLREYAASNFLKHLYILDRSQMRADDKIVIIKALYNIFNERDYIELWVDSSADYQNIFLRLLLDETKYIDCVRQWFGDEVHAHLSFNKKQRTNMQKAASSSAELFTPLNQFWANILLNPAHKDALSYDKALPITALWFLHSYHIKFHDDASAGNFQNFSFDTITLQKLEIDRIIFLANLYDFPKTSVWHRQVAVMLDEFHHDQLAISYLEKALELDSSNWPAKALLALCYASRAMSPGDKDGLYGVALLREVVQVMPVGDPRRPRILGLISTIATTLGDYEIAALMSKEALKINPEDTLAMVSYLLSLFSNNEFQAMADCLNALSTVKSSQTGETALMDFLTIGVGSMNLYTRIGRVLREVGKIDWAHDIFRQALGVAERAQNLLLLGQVRMAFASFLLEQTDNSAEALILLEETLKSTRDLSLKNETSQLLSEAYFDGACKAHQANTGSDIWIQKLNDLAVQRKTMNDNDDETIYGINDASSMLGKWYRLHNNADKAKACFRPAILQGIDILMDDDPDNDMDGYVKLAKTLLHASDMRNASTAFAVSVAPLDRLKAEKKEKTLPIEVIPSANEPKGMGFDNENGIAADRAVVLNSTTSPNVTSGGVTLPLNVSNDDHIAGTIPAPIQAKDDSPTESSSNLIKANEFTKHEITAEASSPASFRFECKGLCYPTVSRGVQDFSAFYHCEICRDISFCDQCLGLLKTGRLMMRICSPDHTFYKSYPLPTILEDVGVVDVGGKILPRAGWLKEMRETWDA